jgi:dienelactone hydrolase
VNVDTRVFDPDEADLRREDMDRSLDTLVRDINRRDVAEWSSIDSLEAWEAFKQPRLAALERSLGDFPEPAEAVSCEITGALDGDGYVIEKLVFESRPGIAVTANVYRPANGSNSVGILLTHSHHNPKTQPELQDMGAMWARAGCTVLVMDQFGYGERREHPEGPRHDYWNRYNTGVQLQLIGDSLMGWMVWDIRRGIDVLEQRYGAGRIVVMGSVAGGGDPCAVAAALDERVEVAIPFNFGGPQPETVHPLPKNANLAFNYLGKGSWETTRNLVWSGRDGFLPWVIVGWIAPRKLIYAHEFKWDRDNDPVWRRLQTIYGWYGASDCLDYVHGFGEVTSRPPNASHCNNVGPIHRERIHLALERWLGIAGVDDREDRRDEGLLLCGEPEILPLRHQDTKKGEGGSETAGSKQDSYLEVIRGIGQERTEAFRRSVEGLGEEVRMEKVREAWQGMLGDVERFGLRTNDVVTVPVVLMGKGEAKRMTVVVSAAGKAQVMADRGEVIEELLEDWAVCLLDVRGVGELEPEEARTFRSRCAGRAATALMVGETVVGIQLRDLRTVIAHLRGRGCEEIRVEGRIEGPRGGDTNGTGRDDPADRDYPDESDVVARQYVEPMGAVLSYLARVFEEGVEGGEMPDVGEVLKGTVVAWPGDAVVPGMATLRVACGFVSQTSKR